MAAALHRGDSEVLCCRKVFEKTQMNHQTQNAIAGIARCNKVIAAPVSVVIPYFRSEKTIARAIDSVFNQSWRPAELIIVDDAGPDDAFSFVQRISETYPASWIKLFRRATNGGPGLARNDGWEAASQKYVAFLDADDSWHVCKTQLQLSFMLEHSEMDISSTRRVMHSTALEHIDARPRPLHFKRMIWKNDAATSGTIARRSLPQRFPLARRLCEDYFFWLSALSAGCNAMLLDAPLAFTHKAPYGEAGLSAELWAMERNELGVYRDLNKQGKLSLPLLMACSAFSLAKFGCRLLHSKL
jgi:glycosyltransferase involved in cell wall biosynthesis